jgi:dTDP-4-amino-4,6-dideoxygalactose transaminase
LTARLLRGTYLRKPHAPVDRATERFYLTAFDAVEQYLEREVSGSGVPTFIPEMAAALDWGKISRKRRRNWRFLHALLANRAEALADSLPPATVPLGYPVLLPAAKRDRIRRALAAQRVFCPVHWPLPVEVCARSFPDAARLSRSCLTLPIDQRYGEGDLGSLSELFLKSSASWR